MRLFGEQLYEYSEQNAAALTVSVGIASYPEDGQTFEELYQRAAQFMYKAKQNGKQQYCFGGQLYRFNALADGVSKDEDKQ